MRKSMLATLAILLVAAVWAVAAPAGEMDDETACALEEARTAGSLKEYSDDEMKVVRFIADKLVAGAAPNFSGEEIAEGAGVTESVLDGMDTLRVHQGVIAELTRRGADVEKLIGGGNCSRFSACSIDRDLSGASGAELARYEAEKAQDGTAFADWAAPDFTLARTTGEAVSLSDYRGKNVALVFLSGHCNHSLQTLPLLAELREEYKTKGLELLPVYINSGSLEDVATWSASLGLDLPLVVAEEKELAKAYDFRMVPTTFLIDEKGRVTSKLVGQKDKASMRAALDGLLGS